MNVFRTIVCCSPRLGSLSQCYRSGSVRHASYRKPSPCDVCMTYPGARECFDTRNMVIERGNNCHAKLIRSFLYAQYWPREPSVCALWMPLDSHYLQVLTDKFSYSGDRFLAFEKQDRTNEKKLIGVLVANQVSPWKIHELEEWAHYTYSKPERYRMYFCAHCLQAPKLFEKYCTDVIYDVEVLGTSSEVTGHGVATKLLSTALHHAQELRHPLVQVVAVSQYICTACEKCGMKREWSMDYSDYVDDAGQRVFYPRRPHHTVSIYVKYFDPKKGGELPCEKQFYDS